MLRFKEGDFVFDADTDVQMKHAPVEVEPTLETAETMLDEWKSIESVVPSLDHQVRSRPALKGDEITISRRPLEDDRGHRRWHHRRRAGRQPSSSVSCRCRAT